MGVLAWAITFLAAGFLRGAISLNVLSAPERLQQRTTGRSDQSHSALPDGRRGVSSFSVSANRTMLAPVVHAGLQVTNAHSAVANDDDGSGAITTFILSTNASANASAWRAQAKVELEQELSPHMSHAERRLFKRYLKTATNYFEFGSGGSTEWAAKATNLKHIHTVESDAGWISTLRKRNAVHQAEKDGRLQLEHVDIGPTGSWGRPIGRGSVSLWHKYSDRINKASEGQWDVIFIDGRFRVSCFLKGLLKAPDATLIIHDYKNREEYHVVERFARKVASADSLYVFQRKEEADMQRLKWWAEHSETDPA